MINQKTVLILGAGASMPFGFPSGQDLVALIDNMLFDIQSETCVLLKRHGYDEELIQKFREHLIYSGRSSVDEFLEHRTEFLDIGKEVIVAALLDFEKSLKLFDKAMKDNWYQHLFSLLNISFNEFDQNKLAIITFNYDRSLEYYFSAALCFAYGKNIEECAEKLNKIPIVHVHGKLGRLPWEKSKYSEIPYDMHDYPDQKDLMIRNGSKNINIIHENIEKNEEFDQAHQLINEAERIYFLGFGYHPTNLARLIGNLSPRINKEIGGTTFGMSLSAKNTAMNKIARFKPNVNSTYFERNFFDREIYEYLYDYVTL